MTNKERAKTIVALMTEKDMTKAELQRESGLHINTVRNLLDGLHSPNASTLEAMAIGLGVKPAELI